MAECTGLKSRCWMAFISVEGYPAPPVHGGAQDQRRLSNTQAEAIVIY